MAESTEVNRYIIPFSLAVMLLHAWGAFAPSHYNWGFHQFAFYPLWAGLLALVLCGANFFDGARVLLLQGLSRFTQRLALLPGPLLFLILGSLLVLAAVVLKAKGLLLGDSYLLSQLTPENPNVADQTANFRNQPLTYALIRGIRYVLGGGAAVSVDRTYEAVGIVAGLCFLAVLFAFLKDFSATALDRALIGSFLLFRVASEFFLGYIENYAFFYVGVAAYLCCSWMAIENRVHWSVPVVLFLVAVGLHLGSLVFLPSLIVVLLARGNTKTVLWTLGGIALAGIAIVAISGGGLGFEHLTRRIEAAMLYDFLSFGSTSAAGAYAVFSRAHLVDWGNALMMSAPFTVLGAVFIAVFWKRLWEAHKSLLVFLLTASAAGILFTFVFNPGLGMARDWDLISVFFLPASFLTIFGLVSVLKGRQLRHALVILVMLRLLRTGAWFGINANEEDHIQRAEMLTAPELSGPIRKYYYEAVADLYWKRGEFDKARQWYELYYKDDSLNARIVANLSSCYERLGDTARSEAALSRAADLGSRNAGVYSNLGLRLLRRGKVHEAIARLEQAVRLNPSFAMPHANLATAYRRTGRLDLTAEHAAAAVQLGLNEPSVIKTAALAYRAVGKDSLALTYLDLYLLQAPLDNRTRAMRDELERDLTHRRR